MVNPGGIGRPRRVISARLAPLPPSSSRCEASPSVNSRIHRAIGAPFARSGIIWSVNHPPAAAPVAKLYRSFLANTLPPRSYQAPRGGISPASPGGTGPGREPETSVRRLSLKRHRHVAMKMTPQRLTSVPDNATIPRLSVPHFQGGMEPLDLER